MDEKKLILLLKEHHEQLSQELHSEVTGSRQELIREFNTSLTGLRQQLSDEFHSEITGLRREMREDFTEVKDSLSDLKASSRALDDVLEQHPVPRIERIEERLELPAYIPVAVED